MCEESSARSSFATWLADRLRQERVAAFSRLDDQMQRHLQWQQRMDEILLNDVELRLRDLLPGASLDDVNIELAATSVTNSVAFLLDPEVQEVEIPAAHCCGPRFQSVQADARCTTVVRPMELGVGNMQSHHSRRPQLARRQESRTFSRVEAETECAQEETAACNADKLPRAADGPDVACENGEQKKKDVTDVARENGGQKQKDVADEAADQIQSKVASGSRSSSLLRENSLQKLEELAGGEERQPTRFHALVSGVRFEILSACLVLVNTFVLAMEIQYIGFGSGYEVQDKYYTMPAQEVWPNAQDVFDAVGAVFSVLFLGELLLRLAAIRCKPHHLCWVALDVVVVIPSIIIEVLAILGKSGGMVLEPTVFRIVRLARMIRVVKFLRVIPAFDSLILLIRSIQASGSALLWSFVVLLTAQTASGMLLNQLLLGYINDPANDIVVRRKLFKYFGTYTNSMVTMFEITMANWVPSCRLLVDNVSQWFGLFFIIYRCVFCFALLSVIGAVFISETMRVAASDKDVAIIKKTRAKEALMYQLRLVFNELDASGDGHVPWSEFKKAMDDDRMKTWLSALEIDVRDLELLFKMLDDGDGQVDRGEFIRGVADTMGTAKSSDVVKLLYAVHRLDAKADTILASNMVQGGASGQILDWTEKTNARTASVTEHVGTSYLRP
eukprot:gnl/TRDRNA2_/TRDRNA2_155664_c0_seq1.p1 gnl/TRDRNA2_/TRDRNA2_155664_c0~~gnl/TRDRNA2_/TRDRNA2_155664_c0_seq1.p1  ORF type:complete len:673 (+),score=90.59 gnl/TRDRNA2_/TRDRNA2_155664_c0_seq1:105-2123(+)